MQEYVYTFLIGGLICAVGQVLIDKTKLTPARILVMFVTMGVFLTLIGVYPKIVDIGGVGATIPLTGFGYNLAKGTFKDVDRYGILGAFSGGVKNSAIGITAAIMFGYLVSIAFEPKAKR